jgi:hypothetical protein
VRLRQSVPRRPAPSGQWLTADVRTLARTAYAGHAFDGLPVLADALMEAGCTDEAYLAHLRHPGPHCRGCWVVDLLMGRIPLFSGKP